MSRWPTPKMAATPIMAAIAEPTTGQPQIRVRDAALRSDERASMRRSVVRVVVMGWDRSRRKTGERAASPPGCTTLCSQDPGPVRATPHDGGGAIRLPQRLRLRVEVQEQLAIDDPPLQRIPGRQVVSTDRPGAVTAELGRIGLRRSAKPRQIGRAGEPPGGAVPARGVCVKTSPRASLGEIADGVVAAQGEPGSIDVDGRRIRMRARCGEGDERGAGRDEKQGATVHESLGRERYPSFVSAAGSVTGSSVPAASPETSPAQGEPPRDAAAHAGRGHAERVPGRHEGGGRLIAMEHAVGRGREAPGDEPESDPGGDGTGRRELASGQENQRPRQQRDHDDVAAADRPGVAEPGRESQIRARQRDLGAAPRHGEGHDQDEGDHGAPGIRSQPPQTGRQPDRRGAEARSIPSLHPGGGGAERCQKVRAYVEQEGHGQNRDGRRHAEQSGVEARHAGRFDAGGKGVDEVVSLHDAPRWRRGSSSIDAR